MQIESKIKECCNFFFYKDGNLFWKKNNKKAGALNNDGYIRVQIKNARYQAHRLIFFIHHGYLPKVIDHINGIKNDNRIENLRSCSYVNNSMNQKIRINNTSGYKNVVFQNKKWCVRIRINKKNTWFGSYDDIELANLVAIEARNKFHKEFANHGTCYQP